MRRILVYLTDEESGALYALAQREHREPRYQASYIIHCELKRLGLLAESVEPNGARNPEHAEYSQDGPYRLSP